VLAEKIAATATVVPKSANELIPLPFHEFGDPTVQTKYGMKNTMTD